MLPLELGATLTVSVYLATSATARGLNRATVAARSAAAARQLRARPLRGRAANLRAGASWRGFAHMRRRHRSRSRSSRAAHTHRGSVDSVHACRRACVHWCLKRGLQVRTQCATSFTVAASCLLTQPLINLDSLAFARLPASSPSLSTAVQEQRVRDAEIGGQTKNWLWGGSHPHSPGSRSGDSRDVKTGAGANVTAFPKRGQGAWDPGSGARLAQPRERVVVVHGIGARPCQAAFARAGRRAAARGVSQGSAST